MLEMLVNPKKAERKPWELFFVGIFYSSISLLLTNWIFARDAVLSQYLGILVVTFTVMFSLPFVYYTIRLEEKRITKVKGTFNLLKQHRRALYAFMWLFIGFVVAFSFWYVVLSSNESFKAQIETYCLINRPSSLAECVKEYHVDSKSIGGTGFISSTERLFLIFTNNIYVLMFTLLFSLIFGAGSIFILAWNASVIAAAIGIFAQSKLSALPLGLLRYLIHGLPEIASYFIGGMVFVEVIKHEIGTEKFWDVIQDSLNLVITAIIVLFIAALMEVFLTPLFF